jgi:3',5'-nucleoside bisphosphate phosphatase
MKTVDLHAHTTASDGTMTPQELVQQARKQGLAAVAITDHDTIDGVAIAEAEAERVGIEVVPGVEISLEYKGPKVGSRSGWMHLLVFYLPPDGPLAAELKELQRWRAERNIRIIAKLNELNLTITLEEVAAASGGGQIGRPHFAKVMLDKGYVTTRQEAFDKYLAKGAPAYEDKRRLEPDDAIARARAEGAVPILAHPYSLGLKMDDLIVKVKHWKDMGLCGFEVDYPEHDEAFRDRLRDLSASLKMVASGGSDFHGGNKPFISLGQGVDGNVKVSYHVLEEIKACVRHQE